MPLEPELIEAVRSDVSKRNQPEEVAKRMIAWLEELSQSDVGQEDQARHLDNLRTALVIGESADEN